VSAAVPVAADTASEHRSEARARSGTSGGSARPAVQNPAAVTRATSRRGVLGFLLGIAQYSCILEADVLKALMDQNRTATAPEKGTP
jgi:hypothetical protein